VPSVFSRWADPVDGSEVTKAGLLALVLPIGIVASSLEAGANPGRTVYSLYRTSWLSRDRPVHVATFDAVQGSSHQSAAYNSDNCNRVARVLNEQPASPSKHWCEPGRSRADRARVQRQALVPATRESLRRASTLACNSAVASRISTPEDLAVACPGWSTREIARAEVRFLSGLCKADSIPDCDRLCFHAPADLPRRERTQIVDWACRRRSETAAQAP
jgi:hypothetical protein